MLARMLAAESVSEFPVRGENMLRVWGRGRASNEGRVAAFSDGNSGVETRDTVMRAGIWW